MNFLGVDYGEKRIGLALGSDETKTAVPFGIIENKSRAFIIEGIRKICQAESIGKIVVGLPLTLRGETGRQAKEVKKFVDFLKNNLFLQVTTEDERLTSAMVDKIMRESKNKAERDAVAAMLILQGYFNQNK